MDKVAKYKKIVRQLVAEIGSMHIGYLRKPIYLFLILNTPSSHLPPTD